jgi:hypothetical protein
MEDLKANSRAVAAVALAALALSANWLGLWLLRVYPATRSGWRTVASVGVGILCLLAGVGLLVVACALCFPDLRR